MAICPEFVHLMRRKEARGNCLKVSSRFFLLAAHSLIHRPKVIQEILGHADFDTTMNIYTHITQDMKKSEFDNFAEKLQKQRETSQPKTEADG